MSPAAEGSPCGARPPAGSSGDGSGDTAFPWAEDYLRLRDDMGAIWLERDVLSVSGPDAVEFLQGQLTQEVESLRPGGSAPSLVLGPEGKLVALVRVTREAEDRFLVDTEGGYGPEVASRLRRFLLRTKASVDELRWRCLELRGPGAPEAAGGPGGAPWTLPADWPGSPGVHLLGEQPVLPRGATTVAAAAREAVRIEAGVPRMGAELIEGTIPAETGLVADTVSFTKGCFVGQELVARIDSRGSRVPRRLRGAVVTEAVSPPAGAELHRPADDKVVGHLTSVAFSPALGSVVALCYAHRQVEAPEEVEVRWEGGAATARLASLPVVLPGARRRATPGRTASSVRNR